MNRTIAHNENQQRFEWTEEQLLCVLDYQLQAAVMVITHTGVPSALEGRGIAADLTRTALDTARARGWRVRPVCSYAAAYIKKHPQYQDLVA